VRQTGFIYKVILMFAVPEGVEKSKFSLYVKSMTFSETI